MSTEPLCRCGHDERYHFDDGQGFVRCRATRECECATRLVTLQPEKLKFPVLDRRPMDQRSPAKDWCLAFYVTGGGAAQRFKPGEPVADTIATLRRLADILERSVRDRAHEQKVNL